MSQALKATDEALWKPVEHENPSVLVRRLVECTHDNDHIRRQVFEEYFQISAVFKASRIRTREERMKGTGRYRLGKCRSAPF
jgi:hypothetical protein